MKLLKKSFCLLLTLMMLFGMSIIAEAEEATPFKQHNLPGTINFADFDLGGPGVGHSRMNGQPEAWAEKYRDDATLNFYTSPVLHMGSMPPMWYQYTVNVTKSGTYDVYASAAAMYGPNFVISVDGVVMGEGSIAASGNWTNFWSNKVATIDLTAGKHVITVEHKGAGANIYELRFEYMGEKSKIDLAPTNGAYRFHYLPTRIQAEDYDVDNFYSLDGENTSGEYRKDDAMDTATDEYDEMHTDGYWETFERTTLNLRPNEFVTYTVNVENAGAYSLQFNATKNSTVTAYLNDVELGVADFTATAFRDTYESATVWLDKGEYKLKLVCPEKSATIDYIDFVETDKESYTLEDLKQPIVEDDGAEEKLLANVYKNIYVAPNGSDENDGSKEAPFATWNRANEEVAKIAPEMDGDIVVHFAGGNYPITERMNIDEKISGRNGYKVIYKGDDLLNPPVFNGGKQITGWEKQEDSPIWVADASHLGTEYVRHLFINEFPAVQARSRYQYAMNNLYKIDGSKYNSDGFQISVTNFPKEFTNPEDVMIVWPVLWTTQRTPVDSIVNDGKMVTFTMHQPVWATATTLVASHLQIDPSDVFTIENAFELLDEPGEFYYNKVTKKIYYYPYDQEDMTTADVWAGTTEGLVTMKGSTMQNKVANVEWNNLTFKYAAYNKISEEGVVENQTDEIIVASTIDAVWYKELMKEASVTINFAEYIDIKNCEFACLGANGLNLDNGVHYTNVEGNLFRDIASTALVAGDHSHKIELPAGEERCDNIYIANNVFRRAAYEQCGSAGVAIYYIADTIFTHNDVRDVPYTGVSLGWGWGVWRPEEVRNIHLTHNYVENVTSRNHDGAHIYTLGWMKDSTIAYNHLVKAGDYRGGIYLDQCSAYLTLEENVIQRAENPLFVRAGVQIRRNTAINNYIDNPNSGFTAERGEIDGDQFWNEEINTIKVLDGKWPEGAKKVMAEAGLEPQYSHLLKEAEYPEWRVFAWDRYADNMYDTGEVLDTNRWVLAEEYDDFNEITHAKPTVYPGGHLGDTHPGEWVSFNVDVKEEGNYKLLIRASDGWTGGAECTQGIYIDDEVFVQDFPITRGSWALSEYEVGTVYLTKGKHTLKVEVRGNDSMVGGFKLDSGKVVKDDPNYDDGKIIDQATLLARYEEGFQDIDGHWAYYTILDMVDAGYVKGYSEKAFGPNDAVTLHQACMITLRTLNNTSDDTDWKAQAAELGMLTSIDEPDALVSRERFADIVMKAYKAKRGNYTIVVDKGYCNDEAAISSQYKNAVFGAIELELIEGYEDGAFRPANTLTRAEATTVLYRFTAK
ncbi:MAG: S-layer homology domain-containing protein [Clostridia bacterium]|nr:S-layer homology domain-containing protein [Clostridia bacterium]